MIPKTIHYFWFGGARLSKLAKKCIASWKYYCPDYEVIEWNESNFDIGCCDYVKEAYEAGKWAFVSDYARFKVLYDYGGLYFDTDVEMIKNIGHIVQKGAFMGIEKAYKAKNSAENDYVKVAPGLCLGAQAHHPLYKELLEEYHSRHFRKINGTMDLTTIVDITTECLKRHGLENKNEEQEIGGVIIYPKDYFNPYDMDTGTITITENTVSIHHYAASWVDRYSRLRGSVYRILRRQIGELGAETVRKYVGRQ